MAGTGNNYVTQGISGAIGKELLFRTFKGKTFAGKYPDMSNVIPSKNQTKKRKQFAEAVKYAKSIMNDPEKIAAYKIRPGSTLFHTAISDYMNTQALETMPEPILSDETKARLESISLKEAQLRAITYVGEHAKITNKIYQHMNAISKATATRHLQELVSLNIIEFNNGRGAGAFYVMGSAWNNRLIK
jgi:Fic family protein